MATSTAPRPPENPDTRFSYGHEKLFAFALFQETYEKRLIALVKDRNKLRLQVSCQNNAAAKEVQAR